MKNIIRKASIVISIVALISLFSLGIVSATVPTISNVVKDPTEVPPPIYSRTTTTIIHVNLVAKEVIANLTPEKNFYFWTYNGTVPGPMIRVMEGDTVIVNLTNDINNIHSHNIDFHAVMGPGGGATVTNVMPGETKTLTFKAMRAGAYVYHCAGEGEPWEHVSHGMYGLIMVEPKKGLPPVDKEFYVGQGEWYLTANPTINTSISDKAFFDLDENKAMAEQPDNFSFNGNTNALTTINKKMVTNQSDNVRLFFVNGGPNIGSNFHIIGQIFDKVYTGSPDTFVKNEETVYVAPGSASVFEFETLVPGKYLLVDHALWRVPKGALGFLNVNQTVAPTRSNPFGSWPLDLYYPPPLS